ncbi:extracellular solute-binding protein [Paenibacillus psychroresistens]|uniref:Extracellular solute-binding protein n=1 Tax=Paenibacillus psychroresistens TaxID=1778678 RepID=A0A6B8RIH2_9BACL|nr:ABC transporter substrate-binding protein [Paenibacillus psychroresistens]QGQ96060.1 extracellular solute-binding protein [Paenibacillus psychroresistens]
MVNTKKALFMSLAAIVIISGCSSKGPKDPVSSGAASTTETSSSATTPATQKKVTLKFITQSSPLAPADPNEKLVFQRMEAKTNTHIEWKNYTGDTFAEKRNLAIASGEFPDAIFDAGYSDNDLLKLAKDGTIVPLEDLIEKHMPNFKKVLEQAPQYKAMITAPDGHIYSFPWIEELGSGKEAIQAVDDLPWINVEWLNKLGLKMPTTTEELKQVLIAFKTKDPNGNGKPDEIPLSYIGKPGGEDLAFLFGSFGLGENFDHTVVSDEGKVLFTASDNGYKDGIKYLNDLFKNGLLDIEASTQDWNTYLAKGKDNRYGLYFTWDKGNITGMNDKYDIMPALTGPSGLKNVTRTNGIGLDRGRMVITNANKNLEATAVWADQLYDPLQSVQNNWGTYGDKSQQNIFELDEAKGMLKHLPLDGTAPVELRQKTSVSGPLAILDSYYGTVTTKPDDAAWRLDILKKFMVPDMKAKNNYPKVFFSAEDSKELTKIETDLFAYVMRMRSEWIANGKVDAQWAGYLKELDRLGLQDWLKIKQAGYDANTK